MRVFREIWKQYEAFLRIDPADRSGVIIRARAVYSFGWTFIAIQGLNLLGMTATYGGWTPDHSIAIAACLVIAIVIHAVRFYRNFTVYALIFTSLSVAAPLASALPDGTGINSALLPFLIMTPMLNAFVCGPRMTLATGGVAVAVLGFLYYWSATHVIADSAFYDPRNAQRALQASFAVIMTTAIGAAFSASVHRAFELLEENVVKARAAERAKAVFLSTMSHELRTPLNGVIGLAEDLRREPLTPRQRDAAAAIEQSGASLLQIVNDVLDLSRFADGDLELRPAPFDPRRMMTTALDAWRDSAAAKSLALHLDIAPDLPGRLVGDETRIRQIVATLVGNAVKFTDSGAVSISIGTVDDSAGQTLVVKVRDTGPGVPQAAQQTIFNAFEQADMSDERRRGGAGLGLSICRRLARIMGGDVTLDSAEEFGSTFILTVPAPTGAAAPRDVEAGPLMSFGRRDIRVLVVDDNAVNRMVAGRFLDQLAVAHDAAESGAAAVAMMSARNYDAILMDKHMPGMGGVEAMQAIRRLRPETRFMPIIACTADGTIGEREALLADGFTDYLPKPLRLATLHDSLTRAISCAVADCAA